MNQSRHTWSTALPSIASLSTIDEGARASVGPGNNYISTSVHLQLLLKGVASFCSLYRLDGFKSDTFCLGAVAGSDVRFFGRAVVTQQELLNSNSNHLPSEFLYTGQSGQFTEIVTTANEMMSLRRGNAGASTSSVSVAS